MSRRARGGGALRAAALAALALACATGSACAILAPFPDVVPDPTEDCVPHTETACYAGPEGTEGVGACRGGVAVCEETGAAWGVCAGQVLPAFEACGTAEDENCDGHAGCVGDVLTGVAFGDTSEQRGTGIATGPDGVLMTGYASGAIDFGAGLLGELGSADPDSVLAAFDGEGELRWSKRFADSAGGGVAFAPGGDLVLAGSATGDVDFGGGPLSGKANDVVVARFDAEGQHRWSRRFGGNAGQLAHTVAIDAAGSALIAGGFWGKLDFGGDLELDSIGSGDGFAAKLDAEGNVAWAKGFGANGQQACTGIAADGEGNVVVAGWFRGTMDIDGTELASAGDTSLFVVKLSPAGDLLWAFSAGSDAASRALAVAVDGTGNVLVAGSFRGDLTIGADTHATAGDMNVLVVKLGDGGVPLWSRSFGDDLDQEGLAIAADAAGNVLLSGYHLGSLGIDGAPSTANGASDAFVAKLDPAGAPIWARSFGDSAAQTAAAVAPDALGNTWITGYFGGSFDAGLGVVASSGANDAFLVQLGP